VLVIIPPDNFVAWGGVQETMRQEALENAEQVVARGLDMLDEEGGVRPEIKVRQGVATTVIREAIAENPEIGALVLGAARAGNPGPLVSQFAGVDAGTLPCTVMIVPGGLSREELDRLS
jgi:nucleotide-binding universal stress UspA family protein